MEVFLDMDGVLADWIGGVARTFKVSRESLYEAAGRNAIGEALGLSKAAFWNIIDSYGPDWWEDLEPFPWAEPFVAMLNASEMRTFIASSHGKTPAAAAGAHGKMKWLNQHFPFFVRQGRVMLGAPKYLLASTGRALIDDDPDNIREFIRYGGTGKLFSQPWNAHVTDLPRMDLNHLELGGEWFSPN